ncbi:MAG: LysE family transporter, partial [Propionivibrio sp.]
MSAMRTLAGPLLTGFLSGLALIIAIGSQNTGVLRQALRREHRLPITVITVLSDTLLIFAGIAGLGALVQGNATLLLITRYGGAAF